MRILLTNDDGIDSIGLHMLAQEMTKFGEVVVVAPDTDYSGAGASIGAIHLNRPEVHEAMIDGIDSVFTVNGPPALCVLLTGLGPFGDFDLVVSGINPGANVGRSVYHSGTVGAALTARLQGITGIAVSQKIDGWGIEGQAWEETIADQKWETAQQVAGEVVAAVIDDMPETPGVLNVNVPNRDVEELGDFVHATVATRPARSFSRATLEDKPGHKGAHNVKLEWGDPIEADPSTDVGAVAAGNVSLTWLSGL